MATTREYGRSPDFHLRGMNKRTGQKSGKIGAAWRNEDGSISLRIDYLVALPANDESLVLTLWPVEAKGTQSDGPFTGEAQKPF